MLWSRPLLDQSRASLREYLAAQRIAWVDDPTNDDPAYTRVKARRALQALAPLGITAERVAAVAVNLSHSRNALAWVLEREAGRLVREAAGALIIDKKGFMLLPWDVQRRLLIAALRWLSGSEQAPRGQKVDRMYVALVSGKEATLAGCRLRHLPESLLLVREPRAVVDAVAQVGGLWDGRWLVEGPEGEGQQVAALGTEGLRQCPDWRVTGLHREILLVTPAVWRGEVLVAAPLAGHSDGWKARIGQDFRTFLVSH